MIACLDVHYDGDRARAAAVVFEHWADLRATQERTVPIEHVEPYQPGEFYRRELPCLLAVLATLSGIRVVVIDGYVWLDAAGKRGLGAHLFEALGGGVTVIGVAKTKFGDASGAIEVRRGTSQRPLFVTAAGADPVDAARWVHSMQGSHRIPSLIARADALSRHGSITPSKR